MAHMMKMPKAAAGHMLSHYARSEDIEKSACVVRSNENINPEKTFLNYNLACADQPQKQIDFLHQRLSEVKVLSRKDVNVMVDWVITIPKPLNNEDVMNRETFFREAYEFLNHRYGKENVVSAYVHLDEVTPHMHYAFVPVVQDKKKGGFKLSAKEAVTRQDLKTFHQDLSNNMEHVFGLDIGILNEATKEGNRSIEELKRQSATERLLEATEKASKIVSKAQIQAQSINERLIAVKAEYEAKKAYVRQADKVSDVSVMYPAEAKVTEKGLIHKQKFVTVPAEVWEAKHISANEKSYLQEANRVLENNLQEFRNTTSLKNLSKLVQRVKELEKDNYSLRSENRSLQEKLNRTERESDKIIKKVNRLLDKLPEDMAGRFRKEWKAPERSRGFDMKR